MPKFSKTFSIFLISAALEFIFFIVSGMVLGLGLNENIVDNTNVLVVDEQCLY